MFCDSVKWDVPPPRVPPEAAGAGRSLALVINASNTAMTVSALGAHPAEQPRKNERALRKKLPGGVKYLGKSALAQQTESAAVSETRL